VPAAFAAEAGATIAVNGDFCSWEGEGEGRIDRDDQRSGQAKREAIAELQAQANSSSLRHGP
jgi:hypothetical protein